MAEEVAPKNIIMIGPTGVGKTEIARRLARLSNSPFTKVEASKFTEVGYVGRDVESMVRDLVEIAVDMVREERLYEVQDKAEENAEEKLLDLLLPPIRPVGPPEEDLSGRRREVGLRFPRHEGKAAEPAPRGKARQSNRRDRSAGKDVSDVRDHLRRAASRRWTST